jgi:hypothetical protein
MSWAERERPLEGPADWAAMHVDPELVEVPVARLEWAVQT